MAMAGSPAGWAFSEATLDNGLRVITLENHRAPLVAVEIWYHVGSKDENPDRQGFAHMFEHMMFRGTDRIGPQDHFKYLNRYGARVNGYTDFDQTVYWETVPKSQLNLALWLEAERMANLKINEDYFAAEREVVKEERRKNYLNRPYGLVWETVYAAAYTAHPYRWTPIGNMEHLNAATAEELRAFFRTYYIPNNATLVVVGDIRHDEVMERARAYFGAVPRGDAPPRVTAVEPAITSPRRIEITDRVPSPRVVLAYRAPSDRDLDAIPVGMLARILSTGQSSRLYRNLVRGKELAVDVWAWNRPLEQDGLFLLSATLKPGVSIETGEAALRDEIRRLIEDGIETRELEKARNQAIAEYLQDGQTVQGQASRIGYSAVILGDVNRVNTDLDRYRRVTPEDVLRVAGSVFQGEVGVTVVVRPDENQKAGPDVEDKSKKASEEIADFASPDGMPVGMPPAPVDLPFSSLRRLPNGLQVIVSSDRSVPAVTVSVNLMTGAKDEPADRSGLAHVTAQTLRRGTRKHTGDELADLVDFHAMNMSTMVGHIDMVTRLWTLSEHLDLAVELLAEVVREPTFPDDEVRGFVTRATAEEAIREKDPGTVASRQLARALFDRHYLARPSTGTSKTLPAITREAVVDFHRQFFAPDVATIVFAGDVSVDRAFALAERWFSDWEGRSGRTQAVPPPPARPTEILLVDKPGAVQSELQIGQVVSLSRKDPDYVAARLLGRLFGESFSGRLNRTLRIEKGLTYGAWGSFNVDVETASFNVGTFTRTEKTAEAIRAALNEIGQLRLSAPTDAELAEARDALVGQLQMSMETPAQVAGLYWNLIVWGLPERWYTDYQRAVRDVADPHALQEAAVRTLDVSRLTVVVVGDQSRLKADLAAIAPVRVVGGP